MNFIGIAAAAVLGLLLLIIGFMAIGGDPLGGEPYVVVELDPDERPVAGAESPSSKKAEEARSDSPEIPAQSPSGPQASDDPAAPEAARTAAVSIDDLLEPSRYGPLPKIAADGRRPSEIYARPSSHSGARQTGEPARIAILVNGLGLSEIATDQAINMLPGSVTLGYSPYGRNLEEWVRLSARRAMR